MEHTPGPWRVRRSSLDPDHPNKPPVCYGITAGEETWHSNMGHFHPEDVRYPEDEVHVVEIGYDRDYNTPQAAIPREADAYLIAAAPELLEALEAFVETPLIPLGPHDERAASKIAYALTQAETVIAKARGVAKAPPAEAEGASR